MTGIILRCNILKDCLSIDKECSHWQSELKNRLRGEICEISEAQILGVVYITEETRMLQDCSN